MSFFGVRKNYTEDQVDHNMEVTGWGVTASGTKYWVVRTGNLTTMLTNQRGEKHGKKTRIDEEHVGEEVIIQESSLKRMVEL